MDKDLESSRIKPVISWHKFSVNRKDPKSNHRIPRNCEYCSKELWDAYDEDSKPKEFIEFIFTEPWAREKDKEKDPESRGQAEVALCSEKCVLGWLYQPQHEYLGPW